MSNEFAPHKHAKQNTFLRDDRSQQDATHVASQLLEEYLRRLDQEPDLSPETFLLEHPEASPSMAASLATVRLMQNTGRVVRNRKGDQQPLPFQRLGEFEIERVIGRGGMGIVFLARQGSLNRRVALKVLPTALAMDPIHRQRFQLEAKVAAGLEHPHIVPVYAIGTEQDVDYYAMQYIDGLTIADWLVLQRAKLARSRVDGNAAIESSEMESISAADDLSTSQLIDGSTKDGRVNLRDGSTDPHHAADISSLEKAEPAGMLQTPREIARVGLAVAQALSAAHIQGIIHRDVKPSNILLDQSGKPYVSDFGLAHVEQDTQLTTPGAVIGSLRYMSPEQLDPRRDAIDARCDIYGLGATLYEMLTLSTTVSGGNQRQVLNNLLHQEIVPPRKVNKLVPRDLETIVLTALRPDRRQRYSSALEMARDLAAFLENRPIAARRHAWHQHLQHWAKRNPLVASLSAILLLLLLGGAVASSVVAYNMRKLANDQAVALDKLDLQKSRAESLLQFLVDTFRSPDPAVYGPNFTVASMLQQASEKVLLDTSIDDEARGDLLDAIAQSYRGLGEFEAAAEAWDKCLKLRKQTHGEYGLPTLQAMTRLALARRDVSDLSGSIQLYTEALPRLRQHFTDDHPDTLEAMGALAMAYQDDMQLDAAEPLHRESLERRLRVYTQSHPATLQAMNNLALWLQESGRFEEAYNLHRQTYELRVKALTERHPDSLQSMANLVGALQDVGKLDEALPLQERTLVLHREVLGGNHPNTLICLNNTALLYADLGRVEDCVTLFEEVLSRMRSKLGDTHQDTLTAMGNLAYFYQEQGKFDQAIALAGERLQAETAKRETQHVILANSHSLLALCYFGRAQQLAELPEDDERPPQPASRQPSPRVNDLAKSVEHYHQAVTIFEKELAGTWRLCREQSRLGEAMAEHIEERQWESVETSVANVTAAEVTQTLQLLESSQQQLHQLADDIPSSARAEILADADRRFEIHRNRLLSIAR